MDLPWLIEVYTLSYKPWGYKSDIICFFVFLMMINLQKALYSVMCHVDPQLIDVDL